MTYQGTKLPNFDPRDEAVQELEIVDVEDAKHGRDGGQHFWVGHG